MRLIDADGLIKTIRENDYLVVDYFNSTDRGMFTSGILQAIDEQPSAQPEQRWIPCSERLPEEYQYNLVTMQHANGEIDVVIARLVKPYSKNVPWEWESDDAEWTWSFGNGFAWMPLPEPWRGEGHGE